MAENNRNNAHVKELYNNGAGTSAKSSKKLSASRITRSGVFVRALDIANRAGGLKKGLLRFSLYGNAGLYSFYLGKSVNEKKYLAEWR